MEPWQPQPWSLVGLERSQKDGVGSTSRWMTENYARLLSEFRTRDKVLVQVMVLVLVLVLVPVLVQVQVQAPVVAGHSERRRFGS